MSELPRTARAYAGEGNLYEWILVEAERLRRARQRDVDAVARIRAARRDRMRIASAKWDRLAEQERAP